MNRIISIPAMALSLVLFSDLALASGRIATPRVVAPAPVVETRTVTPRVVTPVVETTRVIQASNYQASNQQRRATKNFSDNARITYKSAVSELYQRGILDGYPDGSFNPDWSINRAESLKVLFEAVGENVDNQNTNTGFSDVDSGAWFAKYVARAKAKGVVSGYPDGSFRPGDTVNQVELLKLAFESFGIDLTGYTINNLPNGISADAWFAPYLEYALDHNLLDRNLVNPGEGLSRELFAEIVHRLILQQESLTGSVPTAVVAQEEERLSAAEAAAYEAEQAAAIAAQAARAQALAADTFETVARGSLQAGQGKQAQGNITVEVKGNEVMITLENDFSVSNGPDLFVTLTKENASGKRSLDAKQLITLDALASTNGKQVYTVSKSDFDAYGKNLVIWCKAYNVVFGATTLR